ncbi:Cryptochrome DASH [Dyadobacter sp. CECT 9275]|uniref:Cryptochrome DASH n=1 Tax=Dyadobacter helix TaxID=2822344 RepID=A0A916J7I9_9BACT|nr:deoxyribodipyrimidine photo-lyase [Dyadobacter sp. CECT 9275]CAG4989001.1 Cryptochrome DASH [Dyadobacter sp. CECT 9275]
MTQRIIFWFRNDLRLHDNEALYQAAKNSYEIVPVYVFDPRQFETTRLGFRRTGAFRAQLIIESVAELRNRLKALGADLLIRVGEPEKIIAQLAEDYHADYVYTTKKIGPKETRIESLLSKNLKIHNVDIKLFWIDTLLNVQDLPFSIAKLPHGFDSYWQMVKDRLPVKTILPAPEKLHLPSDYDPGLMPEVPSLGFQPDEISETYTGEIPQGGENTGLELLSQLVNELKQGTSSATYDHITDSRLSLWIALGCVSARQIYTQLAKLPEKTPGRNETIKNLFERDYAHFTLLKYGPRLFKPSGIKHLFEHRWNNDPVIFEKWKLGETENPEINKIMLKLKATGYPNLAERYQAANYLVNELDINWTWGATYFESLLLDYDVAVSWGRWNQVAKVGVE